jgi:hypothetical protein
MRTPNNAWTDAEDALLKANYHRGSRWCCDRLPGRTQSAVKKRAAVIGAARPIADVHHEWTPLLDAQIRRAYQEGFGAPAALAQSTGIPRNCLSRRAAALGLGARPVPFTDDEAEFVERHLHLSRNQISKLMAKRGWRRSKEAIQRFLHARGLGGIGDYLSIPMLAACLGMSEFSIRGSIARGELLVERSEGEEGRIVIAQPEVARWIIRHPHRIDLRRAEGPWLIDLLARYGSLGLIDERDQWRRILALHELGKSNGEIAAILETKANIVASTLSQRRSKSDQRGEAA